MEVVTLPARAAAMVVVAPPPPVPLLLLLLPVVALVVLWLLLTGMPPAPDVDVALPLAAVLLLALVVPLAVVLPLAFVPAPPLDDPHAPRLAAASEPTSAAPMSH
jgi:hypothetical protein